MVLAGPEKKKKKKKKYWNLERKTEVEVKTIWVAGMKVASQDQSS